jgi:hypothetical protein
VGTSIETLISLLGGGTRAVSAQLSLTAIGVHDSEMTWDRMAAVTAPTSSWLPKATTSQAVGVSLEGIANVVHQPQAPAQVTYVFVRMFHA